MNSLLTRFRALAAAALLLQLLPAFAADKPNILWITSEDNASHWLGCYGNKQAQTPRIDALGAEGHLFTAAYSNAPVCAVARSTILTGVYAPSQGTQHMRSRHAIPPEFKPHVAYLKEQGYYCTNASKTDYNIEGNDKAIWHECSGKAHYRNRKDGQPFFAIINFTTSHESSLFPAKVRKNRENGLIPETPRIAPKDINVPPYLPDLPEVRSDFAIYHDTLTALDKQIGKALDDLEEAGLADDTIVFYYGDHGGPTPRGKRYIEDTGVRIPMIVRVPEKWKALTPFATGQRVDEPVAFVDLAPTLLSLVGLEKPAHMQGRAFLGSKRTAPPNNHTVFLFADRFDELYGLRRGITDGRWKYMRRFTPYYGAAPYSYYQFSMPCWQAIRNAWKEGKLSGYHQAMWETPQPVEYLYDTKADPWEVKNLAQDPKFEDQKKALRKQLRQTMAKINDTGIIPEPMFAEIAQDETIHSFARSDRYDLNKTLDLSFAASERNPDNLPILLEAARSKDPVHRYWGAQGLLILGSDATEGQAALTELLNDPNAANRITAAHALFQLGDRDKAIGVLVAELNKPINDYAIQLVINTLTRLKITDSIPSEWIETHSKSKTKNSYLKRFADRLKKGEARLD